MIKNVHFVITIKDKEENQTCSCTIVFPYIQIMCNFNFRASSRVTHRLWQMRLSRMLYRATLKFF